MKTIIFAKVTNAAGQEQLADGDRRCSMGQALSDGNLTTCELSPRQIPSCSATYQLSNTSSYTDDLIVNVYGHNVTNGLKNIGLKIIPDLNKNRQLLSNEEYVGNAWISCKEHKSEKIDMTETDYLSSLDMDMVTYLCHNIFQYKSYLNFVFLFNPKSEIKICEIRVLKRI